MILPRVWAKRANLFVVALAVSYAIKSYILFSSCYNNYCPQKLLTLYLVVMCTLIMLAAAVFPDLKLKGKAKS